jgi:hypothetical protein
MNAVRLPEPDPRRRRQARIVVPGIASSPQVLTPAANRPVPPQPTPPQAIQEPQPLPPPVRLNPPKPTPLFLALVKARRALTGVLTLSLLMLGGVYMSTVQIQQSWAADYKALNQIRQQTRQMKTATGLLEGNLAKETNHPAPFEPARPERVVLLPLLAPEPTAASAPAEKTAPAESIAPTTPITVPLGY